MSDNRIENSVYIGKRCRFPLSNEGRETHLTQDGIITDHYILMDGITPEDWYIVTDETGKEGTGRHIKVERQIPMPLECQLTIHADYTENHPAAHPSYKSTALFKVDNLADITVNARLLCPNFLIMDGLHILGKFEFEGSVDEGFQLNYSDDSSVVNIKISPWPLSNCWDRLDADRAKRLTQALFDYRCALPFEDEQILYRDMLSEYELDYRFFRAVLNSTEKMSDMTLEHARRQAVNSKEFRYIRLSSEEEAALRTKGIV